MLELHSTSQGQGPVVVLSHALGLDLHMWDEVAAALQDRFTVVRYDHRGHGRSPVVPGPYTIEQLAEDAAGVIRSHADGPVHFVGLSLGGMTAQALAAHRPELVASVVVVNSTAHYADKAPWAARAETVGRGGTAALLEPSLNLWLTAGFRATPAGAAAAQRLSTTLLAGSDEGYIASCAAIADLDLRAALPTVRCPALVVAGRHDRGTTPVMARAIADAIPGARLAELDAAHLSAVERPGELAGLIAAFVGA